MKNTYNDGDDEPECGMLLEDVGLGEIFGSWI